MDLQNILLYSLSTIIIGLLTWVTERFTAWLSAKIKDAKNRAIIEDAFDVVTRTVKVTFQTYVDSLKKTNMFTAEAQSNALNKAKETVISQLTDGMKTYIEQHYGDIESWVISSVEAKIYDLKNKKNEESPSEKA